MNHQWFSGDPSATTRKARAFGRDDKVIVYTGGGQFVAFYKDSLSCPPLPHTCVSSRLSEPASIKITEGRRSERMEGSHR